MPRRCETCDHPDRHRIDELLATDSDSITNIARQYGVSHDSTWRHARRHVPLTLPNAARDSEAVTAAKILREIEKVRVTANALADAAIRRGDEATALRALDRVLSSLALVAKVAGTGADMTLNVNMLDSPQWAALRRAIIAALAEYPEARTAVVRKLEVVH